MGGGNALGSTAFCQLAGLYACCGVGVILWGPTPSSLPSPARAQTRLFSQVPSVVAFHFTGLTELFPPPLMNGFLVPQAVSTLPIPAHSQGLTTRAEVSMPSPKPSISVFGDCASSSDDLFSSHSAFQISDLLLHFSWGLEIPLTLLIFPLIR